MGAHRRTYYHSWRQKLLEIHSGFGLNWTIEPSLLPWATHDVVYWLEGGSIQHQHIATVPAGTTTPPTDYAHYLAERLHEYVVRDLERQRDEVIEAAYDTLNS